MYIYMSMFNKKLLLGAKGAQQINCYNEKKDVQTDGHSNLFGWLRASINGLLCYISSVHW